MTRKTKNCCFVCSCLVLALASGAWAESFGELERREYLKPTIAPLEGVAERVVFQEGDGGVTSSTPSTLNGVWTLMLQDGRTIGAKVPGSLYTDLWNAGITGDPYFGTNDLLAATFSTQTNVYRCSFSFSPNAGSRYRLSFGGVTDTAEIWLNGRRLGFHMGMFEAFEYELESSALRTQNILEVKLFPLRKQEDTLTCIITRGFHYCNLPSIGIWRAVTLDEIPEVEARRQFIVTRSAEKREIDYRIDVDARRDCDGELRLSVRPSGFDGKSYCFARKVRLSRGTNSFRYSFALPEAELWWPAGYGEHRVYEMTATVGGSSVTDDFGIRTFRFEPGPDGPRTNIYNRIAVVNGKRLFLKGAGWCICDALLRFDEPMYRRMFDRAVEQGVNFFRAWGNGLVETETFYRLCDREGILVLQEFPIPWYHSAEVIREPIFDMARRSVVRLRNRPSLVVWGGGNELCHNKAFSVRDEVINTVGRICCELDGTRDFWRTDPYAGSEHHHISWSGWTPDEFLRHYADREGVCQNEYGLDTLMNVETLRRISGPEEHDMFPWRHFTSMAHHTATFNYDYIVNDFMRPKGKDVENHVWFGSHYLAQTNLESFVLSSQLAQVYATAYHAYNARTQFPKTGMYTYYKLNDVYPGSSWAVVDWFGSPKLAHYALKRAQRPLCAAPRLAGHEFGAVAKIPFYLLDDAESLGKDSEWTVTARFLDKSLRTVSSRTFSGHGPIGQVHRLGEFANEPACPLTSPSVLEWKLAVDGKPQGEDFVVLNVFDNPQKCAGFVQTALALAKDQNGGYVIRNVGEVAAVGVMLDLGSASDRTVIEDNFFFLDAGASRRISVSPQNVIGAVSALNAVEVR